jgi:predicted thioesterase
MKPSLQPGLTSVKRIPIDRDRTISFMGDDARVYATPRLISDIEFTCRDLILQHADPGEDSVGTEVCVKHLAATLAGSTVEISIRITAVDGRKVSFEVSAKDELDTVSAGTHGRFVVEVARTKERLKAKAEKLAALGK